MQETTEPMQRVTNMNINMLTTVFTNLLNNNRTRVASMAMVKKLNCWGADLTNVSVIRKLHRLETLSLSLNKLTSLADFQHCKNLQELFIMLDQLLFSLIHYKATRRTRSGPFPA